MFVCGGLEGADVWREAIALCMSGEAQREAAKAAEEAAEALAAAAPPKQCSLVFVIDETGRRVLLGYKKRGFGEGKWNGFGGKLEGDEAMVECASRELREESGYSVSNENMIPRGRLNFIMRSDGMVDKHTGAISSKIHVFVYSCHLSDTTGRATESEEMRPQWWSYDDVPLKEMWADDQYWLPHLLAGYDVVGEFTMADKSTLVDHKVEVLMAGGWAARAAAASSG